jgi:hypothetical protein
MYARVEHYQRLGMEAQQRAARATEPHIKEAFEVVAGGWFALAEQAVRLSNPDAERRSPPRIKNV